MWCMHVCIHDTTRNLYGPLLRRSSWTCPFSCCRTLQEAASCGIPLPGSLNAQASGWLFPRGSECPASLKGSSLTPLFADNVPMPPILRPRSQIACIFSCICAAFPCISLQFPCSFLHFPADHGGANHPPLGAAHSHPSTWERANEAVQSEEFRGTGMPLLGTRPLPLHAPLPSIFLFPQSLVPNS